MSVDMSVLRDLHRMHRQVADIQSQLDRGPRQVKAMQTMVEAAKAALENNRTTIRQKKMDADRKQLQLRERESKIKDLEIKLNQAKANREYQTLKEQIAADQQANNVLSDEILETLEEIDALEQETGGYVDRLAEAEGEHKRVSDSVADRTASLSADLQRVKQELEQTETTLSGDFRTQYLRIIPSRGEDAMAEIDGQSCGGCYTILAPQQMDRLRLGTHIVCSSCGRIIYTPEDRIGRD